MVEDDQRAIALQKRYADLNLSLVDGNTTAVMERLGIASIFSFESDYFVAGFLRVPPCRCCSFRPPLPWFE